MFHAFTFGTSYLLDHFFHEHLVLVGLVYQLANNNNE